MECVINRDKATPRRFEIEGRRLIISPSFQPFETQVHKKKKKVEKQGKNQCLNQSTFPSLTEIRGKHVCVYGKRVKRHVSTGKWIPSLRKDREGGRGKKEPASNNSPRSQAMKISLVDRAE